MKTAMKENQRETEQAKPKMSAHPGLRASHTPHRNLLAVATAVYIPYSLHSPQGPRGGSPLGLTYGIAGFLFMLFVGLLGARKKVPVWRVGRAQSWMRGHLWLGLLSFPLILFHGGFHFGGPLTRMLMWLFI